MLLDVITRVAADTGIDLTRQRSELLSLYNAASRMFHNQLQSNKMYREVTLVVPPDQIISLPPYIGEIKGLRVHTTEMLIPLQTLNVPRYTNSTLLYKIKNWRDLGDSPVQTNLTVVGQLTLACNNIENPPAIVKITGQTNNANKVEEVVTMSSNVITTQNQFGPRIDIIASFSSRLNDITIQDLNGNTLAVLFNQYSKTRYKLIDVSQIFWPMSDTIGGQSFIDVCYKLPFLLAKNDTDSFAGGDDYDEAMYHMCMHLHYLPMGGKENQSAQELARATMLLKSVKDGTEDGVHKKINWGRNKFYSLFTRGRHRMSGNDYGMYFCDLVDY